MPRTLNFHEVRQQALARGGEVKVWAGLSTRKDQPHDEDYWAAQARACLIRWDLWIASGRLEILGPRRFRLNPAKPVTP